MGHEDEAVVGRADGELREMTAEGRVEGVLALDAGGAATELETERKRGVVPGVETVVGVVVRGERQQLETGRERGVGDPQGLDRGRGPAGAACGRGPGLGRRRGGSGVAHDGCLCGCDGASGKKHEDGGETVHAAGIPVASGRAKGTKAANGREGGAGGRAADAVRARQPGGEEA